MAVLVRLPDGRSARSPTSATTAGRRSTSSRPARRPAPTSAGPACEGTHPHASCIAPGAIPPIYEYAHDADALLDHRRLRRPRPDRADARRPLPLLRLLRHRRERDVPVPRPPSPARARLPHPRPRRGRPHRGLRLGLRRPPLHHLAGRGRVARHRHGSGRQAARRELHALEHDAAVGATVHLDASGSTDPDGPIVSYSWDIDGDGTADGKGVTFDVSYPTAGARADHAHRRRCRGRALVAHPGRVRRRQGRSRGPAPPARSRRRSPCPSKQTLKSVRKRGLLVRFRSDMSASWTTHGDDGRPQGSARLARTHGCAPRAGAWP